MAKAQPVFYVFHGPDEFTRSETLNSFKQRLGPSDTVDLNTTELDGRDVSMGDLRHHCDAIPFMADRRLVIVHGLLKRLSPSKKRSGARRKLLDDLVDYLPTLPQSTRLVFVDDVLLSSKHRVVKLARSSEQGYEKQFKPPKPKQLPSWVQKRARKYGGEVEPRAAHRLATLVGDDLRLLDQEIQKLITYTDGQRPITSEDVDLLVPYVQEAVIFDLVDALGQRDGRTASQILHRLLDEGEHPLGLLGMIVRQFRLLIQVKELKAERANPHQIAKRLNIHPYPARKLHGQANHFTAEQLEKVYRHLLETDVAIKTGKLGPTIALDLLVAGLAEE